MAYTSITIVSEAAKERRRAKDRERYRRRADEIKARKRNWYQANAEKERARAQRYACEHPHYRRDWKLRNDYGITFDGYKAMFDAQGGVCAICFAPPSKQYLSVDHCHTTGVIRALLCNRCNSAIGLFDESVEHMTRAIAYLRKHRKDP